jgi:NAD(P)H-dependent FMN reductase
VKTTILATSLREDSKSQMLALMFTELMHANNHEAILYDFRNILLPFSGPKESWNAPIINELNSSISSSTHIVFAVPIYCYDVNSVAKNIIELLGQVFKNKVISFICSAGGANSYMSVISFANHMMLDFRSIIVPRFLYVEPSDWVSENNISSEIKTRMDLLLHDMNSISYSSTASQA